MIYIDSSCVVQLFRPETGSNTILETIRRETAVVVSSLVELETLVQLKAFYLVGDYNRQRWRQQEARFFTYRQQPPFVFRTLSSAIFQTALRQHRNSQEIHCRTLDRLHLAAMEELDITRLMTHDDRQAKAARAAGFEVLQPGRSVN